MTTLWEMAVHLALAGDVFDGVLFCAVFFSHEMSWIRSGIELSQFLRIFLPTFASKFERLEFISLTLLLRSRTHRHAET